LVDRCELAHTHSPSNGRDEAARAPDFAVSGARPARRCDRRATDKAEELHPHGGDNADLARDAAHYITKPPKAAHDAEEWQAAMEALLLVAERAGPAMFARIGVMRALQRHEMKAAPAPRRKAAKAVDHLKVFANADAAETWFEENDPEGVAFEYEVLE
jgi:hypothetical protein